MYSFILMDHRNYTALKICVVLTLLYVISASAQGSIEDYKRSIAVDSLFKNKVYNVPKDFHWQNDHILWYVNKTKQGLQYIKINAKTNTRNSAFDHLKMARSLSDFLGTDVPANAIEIHDLQED